MSRYRALIFDLCDTVMPFRNDRMPEVNIRGETIYSTSPLLYNCFKEYNAPIPYEQFHDHFTKVCELIVQMRASGPEVLASTRFEIFLDRLKLDSSNRRAEIHQKFLQIHLGQVADCLSCPDENRTLLLTLKEQYRIGLVTNFDDVKTAYSILDRERVRALFGAVLISAEFGLRKPRREIFLEACQRLAVDPAEALFIGDSLTCDVAGAQGVGMDVAWINLEGVPFPEEARKPNYILSNLTDLLFLLNRLTRS